MDKGKRPDTRQRRRLASAALEEEKRQTPPQPVERPKRVFPPPPPPECVIVSRKELVRLVGSNYVLCEMGLMNQDYVHLLNDEVEFVITQKPRTQEDDDCYDPLVGGNTTVEFKDRNGGVHHLHPYGHLATNIALIRLAGRPKYKKGVMQALVVGLHSPASSISRAFNSALGEINVFRCILEF